MGSEMCIRDRDIPLKKKKKKKNSRIGYRASLRGLTFFSPLWGHTLLHLMATLSLEKVSLVTRGHHEEVVAVGSHA